MNAQEYSKVMVSNDYSQFKFINGNRNVDFTNLNQIIKSMKEKQLMIPIIVNQDLEIIDGQHRFMACKNLNLPVYFILEKGYDMEDVIRANVNGGKKWNDADYLNKYCTMNDERYLKIKGISNHYCISLHDYQRITAFVQDKKPKVVKQEFREGNISFEGIEQVVAFLDCLRIFDKFQGSNKSNFILAFAKLFFHEGYDHKHMLSKMELYAPNLKVMPTSEEYLALLCNKIYSYGGCKNAIYYSPESRKFHS